MSIELIVIKPIGNRCNLRCGYCYAYDFPKSIARNFLMSGDTLKRVIKFISSLNPPPILLWSGGEPLLAGMEFFDKVIKSQAHLNFINSIQTNGVLINKDWISFMKRHNFQLGISWDGFMDSERLTPSGQNVAKKVWENIELCLQENLNLGIIVVVTNRNIRNLIQIAENLYSRGIKNLLFKPYVGKMDNLSLTDTNIYVEVMRELSDLWLMKGDKDWALEPIYSFVKVFSESQTGIACNLVNNCGNFLTIDYDGVISCCDFIPQRFVFGNVHDKKIREIPVSDSYRHFYLKRNWRPEKCAKCVWQDVCGGGCLHYREFDNSSGTSKWGSYIFCEATKSILNYCKQKIG